MSTPVIATAGHVDHGKSTLVRALTGMDPDRFSEEKERGLTIDLGFAWTELASGREIAFVDVPGHVRFLKNMLAGVGAVDACLFVVSAAEGWKPQSEEHLRILGLLGIGRGVVALTNVAALPPDELELARLEVEAKLGGTFLAGAPMVAVDPPAGVGLAELREVLDTLVEGLSPAADGGRPRLWVDRCFAMKGSGTVVTGTLAGGMLAVGDLLEVVPGPPPEHRPVQARVRGLQSHLRSHDRVGPGRVAVNLSGVDRHQLARGQALVLPGQWEPTMMLDATLSVLPALGHEVERRGDYRAHFGSGQHTVRLRLLGSGPVQPGESGTVRIHLPLPLALVPGDRYVLRETGRSETVGGGEVLDVAPVLSASRARPDGSVERIVEERGFVEVNLLERLTGKRLEPNVGGRWVASERARDEASARLSAEVAAAGPLGLDAAQLSEIDRVLLASLDGVDLSGGRARDRATFGEGQLAHHPFVAALEASLFRPPSPAEEGVDRNTLRELLRTGTVIESGGIYFAPAAMTSAASVVSELLSEHPEGLSASMIREALGTSRKYLIPLLAHLDATGVTRRRGDLRVGGPRLQCA